MILDLAWHFLDIQILRDQGKGNVMNWESLTEVPLRKSFLLQSFPHVLMAAFHL